MSRGWKGFVSSILFPAPVPTYSIDSFPGELVWVPKGPVIDPDDSTGPSVQSCESVPCLLLPYESARFLIIFFHSNAEDLGRCRWFCLFLRDQFQVHVLALEYPGYGICPGETTREGIIANAHAALQFATQALKLPLERIKLFGRSIGTGATLALAAKFKVAGVILVTPFMSMRKLFRDKVGPFGGMLLWEEWFANEDAIKEVRSPVMIIHGRKDVLIPCYHGEALYNMCPTRKLFINPQHMEHNTNLTSDISYLIVPMFRFFALPDYSFQELKIPQWAYDKRRSPLYVRPEVQVCSHTAQVPARLGDGSGTMMLPAGDNAELPVDEERTGLENPEELASGRTKSAFGDSPPVDYEKLNVLTQPTVLHSYSATKQRYIFQDPNGIEGRTDGGAAERGEEVPLEVIKVLRPRLSTQRPGLPLQLERRNPLGSHGSATKPSTANSSQGPRPQTLKLPEPAGEEATPTLPPDLPPGQVQASNALSPCLRQVSRGASKGTAYGELRCGESISPTYDGEQPRLPRESTDVMPLLTAREASEEELSDTPEIALHTVSSNGVMLGPQVPPKPSPMGDCEVPHASNCTPSSTTTPAELLGSVSPTCGVGDGRAAHFDVVISTRIPRSQSFDRPREISSLQMGPARST
mmetsp:Transcript_716/g.1113  ORF Transcript_716/g.1113 Transcript_716/m.1113 type:complete len:639 (-) Transcript_716:28-1944(-)